MQEHGELSYREVLARCLAAVSAIEGLELPHGRHDALAESLPSWPPFAEVPAALAELRERGWRLADPLEHRPGPAGRVGGGDRRAVRHPDHRREAGSYKPAPGHWERFFAETGAARDRHVHVAASLFHDIEPAARMGLAAVWINRLAESSELPRAAELPDLSELPDALDELAR